MIELGQQAGLLGESEVMERLRAVIRKVAPTNLSVLIQGPTGAGKELVAQALHELSGRRGALVACNICALPDTLFEDALFGHVRGGFSGAFKDSAGLMLEADRGTLFLDEIGGLSGSMQPKLLRAIELRQFRPVGASADRHSDFRVIAATHEDLRQQVADGGFRLDLFVRMAAVPLRVPGLDERVGDIPLLVRHFVRQATGADSTPFAINDEALRYLQGRSWPGNVRQLKHVVACAVTLAECRVLTLDDVASAADALELGSTAIDRLAVRRGKVIAILQAHEWHVASAASELGIHRATLFRWIKRLRISTTNRFVTRPNAPLVEGDDLGSARHEAPGSGTTETLSARRL